MRHGLGVKFKRVLRPLLKASTGAFSKADNKYAVPDEKDITLTKLVTRSSGPTSNITEYTSNVLKQLDTQRTTIGSSIPLNNSNPISIKHPSIPGIMARMISTGSLLEDKSTRDELQAIVN